MSLKNSKTPFSYGPDKTHNFIHEAHLCTDASHTQASSMLFTNKLLTRLTEESAGNVVGMLTSR